MKHIFIFLFLLTALGEASAQYPRKWFHLNGPNVGSHEAQLLFGPNGEIISVGKAGYYQTTNDGISWQEHRIIPKINCQYSNNLSSGLVISFSGEYYFYFGSCDTTDKMGVYRSTDNGNSWAHMLSGKNVLDMKESSDHTLFVYYQDSQNGVNNFLLESIDKGKSWVNIATYNQSAKILGFTPQSVYMIESSVPNLVRCSITGGKFDYFGAPSLVAWGGAVQLENNLLMVADYNGNIYTFSDGNTWNGEIIGKLSNIASLSKGRLDTIYATAYSDDHRQLFIYASTNIGKDWNKIAIVSEFHSGAYSTLYNNPKALLFENDTGLYLSRDLGNSWKAIGLPFDSITKILVADDEKIFCEIANHSNGPYYSDSYFDAQLSSDVGKSWYKSRPADSRITGFGKGINRSILATASDSNETWNSVWLFDSSVPSQWVKRSAFQDIPDHPLIASDSTKEIYISKQSTSSDPFMYRSDDTAFTWNELPAPNDGENIYSLDVSAEGTVYYGTYPAMFRSEDHGVTWTKLIPTREIVQLSAIKTFGASGVLLGTSGAGLLKSLDKGNSWTRIDGNNFDTVTSIGLDSKGTIAAGTNRGLWLFDIDKQSWAKVMLGTEDNLYIGGIDVAKNDDIYVGTYGSSVWMATTHRNAVTTICIDSSLISIFPNPATSIVKISFELPQEKQIALEIYDVLGRRIALLANEKISGRKEFDFDASRIASGIYTVIFTSDGKKEMDRLIVNH